MIEATVQSTPGPMKGALWLTLLVCCGTVGHCARFLAVMPPSGKSHSIWHYSIFHQLIQRGHEVVMYGCYPPPSPINITYVDVCKSNLTGSQAFYLFKQRASQTFFNDAALTIWPRAIPLVENVLKNEKIQQLLQSQEKFDIIFTEALIGRESLVVFGHKFKAPVINMQAYSTWAAVNWITGNPLSVAHIPSPLLPYGFTNKMSFKERLITFVSTVNALLVYHFDHLPRCEKLIQTYYNDPKTPPLTDMLWDISLTLVNSHQTLEYPRPYSPNVVPIGGAHLSYHSTPLSQLIQTYYNDPKTPPLTDMLRDISLTLVNSHQTLEYPRPYSPNVVPIGGAHLSYHSIPLTQNIKEFLDEAKEGAIFFSLGTAVPTHEFTKDKLEAFIRSFSKLPYKILWKINADSLPNLSKNVMLTKWVSQITVLAHPNCVLFITHGGQFSQHEAFHAGVPVVAIPFFGDQSYNVGFYEHLGVGVKLDFNSISENTVLEAITSVLGVPRYRDNAKRVSAIVRDKPVAPTDSAVFWVEYVLRHRGAHHLRPASADLPWYQLFLLDVMAVVVAAAVLTTLILYQLIKTVLRLCCNLKTNVTQAKKRN